MSFNQLFYECGGILGVWFGLTFVKVFELVQNFLILIKNNVNIFFSIHYFKLKIFVRKMVLSLKSILLFICVNVWKKFFIINIINYLKYFLFFICINVLNLMKFIIRKIIFSPKYFLLFICVNFCNLLKILIIKILHYLKYILLFTYVNVRNLHIVVIRFLPNTCKFALNKYY